MKSELSNISFWSLYYYCSQTNITIKFTNYSFFSLFSRHCMNFNRFTHMMVVTSFAIYDSYWNETSICQLTGLTVVYLGLFIYSHGILALPPCDFLNRWALRAYLVDTGTETLRLVNGFRAFFIFIPINKIFFFFYYLLSIVWIMCLYMYISMCDIWVTVCVL
jgi:hypothetical protein